MKTIVLDASFSLTTLQSYVREMEESRGFAAEDSARKGLLLAEEVGEVLKVLRQLSGGTTCGTWVATDLAHELADVLIVLCAIANRFEIALDLAVRTKEEVNRSRTWR